MKSLSVPLSIILIIIITISAVSISVYMFHIYFSSLSYRSPVSLNIPSGARVYRLGDNTYVIPIRASLSPSSPPVCITRLVVVFRTSSGITSSDEANITICGDNVQVESRSMSILFSRTLISTSTYFVVIVSFKQPGGEVQNLPDVLCRVLRNIPYRFVVCPLSSDIPEARLLETYSAPVSQQSSIEYYVISLHFFFSVYRPGSPPEPPRWSEVLMLPDSVLSP